MACLNTNKLEREKRLAFVDECIEKYREPNFCFETNFNLKVLP